MSKKKTSPTDENLTADQKYQKEYYREHKDDRRDYSKDRWDNEPGYRKREIQRARDRRATVRAGKATDRFRSLVEARRKDDTDVCQPLLTLVGDDKVLVYTSGSLSREIGRSPRVIRMWLQDGTLPGATVFVQRRAYFSERMSKAVYRACEELFHLNGRGEKRILKRLIARELARDKITYVPYSHRGDNSVRVLATTNGE